jgi:hypothetical protein
VARVTVRELNAWVERTKMNFSTPLPQDQSDLLEQIEEEVLARINTSAYDTTTWIDETSTPRLVRVAIAKKFVAWAYRRQYSEDLGDNDASYAAQIEANADTIINGIVDGSIEIPSEPATNAGSPVFYPTDESSASDPTWDDPSLGPAKFSMNQVF